MWMPAKFALAFTILYYREMLGEYWQIDSYHARNIDNNEWTSLEHAYHKCFPIMDRY